MTTTTIETPDGERLARLELRVEHLELQNTEIRADIRDIREDIRGLRTEVRESIQGLRTEFRQEMGAQRSRSDRQFLWTLGIIITMWVSLVVMWITSMLTILNRLGE